ncbi:MAG: 4-(cytidine 5'-diphospho)-2-C-methyl-D-erythritol kinase [Bacillota bacterium]|nr:4-(cytidine 5'-diphospho)-2-C-methyl-D-erythritol kinase [Bacillota bacterium]HHU60490.1 4-(cytidine 5'-diphospho)-2-C-methyl-D-erythritol kinase [Natronincola sp.]
MDQISLRAYAKVNLTLDVVGKREDGYHLLESIMQSISLWDTITLKRQESGIEIETNDPKLPVDSRNICWQAVLAFQKTTGVDHGVKINISKGIPVSAGLGGGSADAAAVLYGLNRLFNTNLELDMLQNIGVQIGADVPFCLKGGTVLVQGIGEKTTGLTNLPRMFFVLIKPDVEVSTAEVYGRLSNSAHGGKWTEGFKKALERNKSIEELSLGLANALESVTIELVPEVGLWKKRLVEHGALSALMSGSGPTVFGVFANEEGAVAFKRSWQGSNIFLATPKSHGVEQVLNGGVQL